MDIPSLLAAANTPADITRFPWHETPLGPESDWSPTLHAAVRVLLTSRFAMWMGWGPDLSFLYNDAYARMTLGNKHPWAFGKPAREVWAEIWDEIRPRIERVLSTGRATWDEALLLFLERSGFAEETYHTFSYSPLADTEGRIQGMLCVVSEDTERVIGERRLATLRELAAELAQVTRQDDVLEAASAVLRENAKDLPFTVTYLLNESDPSAPARAAAFTGIPATHRAAPEFVSASGDAPWPLAAADTGPVLVDDLAARFGSVPAGAWSREPDRAIVVPIRQSGQERPFGYLVAALNPFRFADNPYIGFIKLIAGQIAASLANARAYEAERRRAEQLAELDRAKTQFFSNVSHEFRTPLTLLLGPVQDALNDPQLPARQRARLEVMHRNALRLLRLVNALLDFSRIEAGRMRARFRATQLGEYTAELASSFESAMTRAGLRFSIDTDDPLPGAEPMYVDREMWEKLVLNLLANAFKHTFAGEVTITLRERADGAALVVRDTGVGIPAEQLPHIFERFHRVPNARSRTHEGTGIGLALVQELVRLHGGRISVESEENRGTAFTVHLPRGAAHLPSDQVVEREESGDAGASLPATFVEEAQRWLPSQALEDDTPAAAESVEVGDLPASPRLAGARILVADDNADMRDYITRLLRQRGCVVTSVADGRTALDVLRGDTAADLVLSDVMMPGLDGFELLREIRADPRTRTVQVILLSARAGEEANTEGLQAGADDYLVKPFSARELLARVEARVELDRTRRSTDRERERLVRQLEEEQRRLETLFMQAPAAIAVLHGPDHVFVTTNRLYQRLIGNRPVVGKPVADALPEVREQGILELLDTVYRTGEPYIGTALPVLIDSRGDGVLREHYFTFVYQPLREADGSVFGIFAHVMEVSEQVRAQKEAEAARQVAEAANRAKSDFLAAMSHELRTPLNAIGGYAQLLEMEVHGALTQDQRTALQRLLRSQQHLLSLINDVLNFAKLEAGRVEYDIRDIAVSSAVAAVGAMVEPQLEEKGLRYEVNLDPALVVRADPDKLQQILLNLLSNAIKFTASGGGVRVTAAREDDVIALSVEDDGVGIAPERQEAIFDPFVQAHRNLTSSVMGTGLGLSISRDLARAMGGDIVVRSAPGQGSTFTVRLPAAAAP